METLENPLLAAEKILRVAGILFHLATSLLREQYFQLFISNYYFQLLFLIILLYLSFLIIICNYYYSGVSVPLITKEQKTTSQVTKTTIPKYPKFSMTKEYFKIII